MAETNEKKKPFWMDDEEWKQRGLPKLEGNMSDAVAGGVPELKWVERGSIIGAWVEKDGLLIYHFYKRDRKGIFDAAQDEMAEARKQASAKQVEEWQQRIAEHANAELAKVPWWPNFEEVLDQEFKSHFRFHPFKTNYYPEVDSWSVVMEPPNTPTKWGPAQYEIPFSKIALRLGS